MPNSGGTLGQLFVIEDGAGAAGVEITGLGVDDALFVLVGEGVSELIGLDVAVAVDNALGVWLGLTLVVGESCSFIRNTLVSSSCANAVAYASEVADIPPSPERSSAEKSTNAVANSASRVCIPPRATIKSVVWLSSGVAQTDIPKKISTNTAIAIRCLNPGFSGRAKPKRYSTNPPAIAPASIPIINNAICKSPKHRIVGIVYGKNDDTQH